MPALIVTLKKVDLPSLSSQPFVGSTPDVPAGRSARRRVWLWLNLLSLDAPLVAVVWLLFFARSAATPINWYAVGVLALTVWLIYVGDRLLDALPGRNLHPAPRHLFYCRHWRLFGYLAAVGLFALGFMCARIQFQVLRNGAYLFGAVAVYFSVIHFAPQPYKFRWPKEMVVGLIFACGTSVDVWTRMREPKATLIVPVLLFGSLCWLNCVGIEYWEWNRYGLNYTQTPSGLTLRVGERLPVFLLAVAFSATSLWATSFWKGDPMPHRHFLLACCFSSLALLALARNSGQLSTDALRVLADISLLSPLLFLLPQAMLMHLPQ